MAQELQAKIDAQGGAAALRTSVATMHSVGYASLRDAHPGKRWTIDTDKCLNLAGGPKVWGSFQVAKLAGLAKQHGYGIEGVNHPSLEDLADHYDVKPATTMDELVDRAYEVIELSRLNLDTIDFDDQLYLPIYLDLPFKQYDWVLGDEWQDANDVRRIIMKRMIKEGGRGIAVGDRQQSIFGFTGADTQSLPRFAEEFAATILPLSVSWRCPKKVVESIQHISPLIKAAPGAKEGVVEDISMEDYRTSVRAGDAILCRLNAPLMREAMAFIRAGRKAKIEGRDIGKGLLTVCNRRKWGNLDQLSTNLDNILAFEKEKAEKAGNNPKAQRKFAETQDKIDTIFILVQRALEIGARSPEKFKAMIEELFGDGVSAKDVITLSSVHRAKGLEWDRVFILGRHKYMPFKFATQDWELDQEDNLIYVAHTRAKEELYLVGNY
jgi:superfamily I DNA/RNA helicase